MHKLPVSVGIIERRIYLIRGQKVMLDHDLAGLYGVATKVLNQAIKRNIERFPEDFMFQLTQEEEKKLRNLRSQIVTSSWGGRRHLSYAFTEQGVAMLSSVLKSKRAVQVNIVIMRIFVRLREILAAHKDLVAKLEELEKKYEKHDTQIKDVFTALRRLLAAPMRSRRPPIGFKA